MVILVVKTFKFIGAVAFLLIWSGWIWRILGNQLCPPPTNSVGTTTTSLTTTTTKNCENKREKVDECENRKKKKQFQPFSCDTKIGETVLHIGYLVSAIWADVPFFTMKDFMGHMWSVWHILRICEWIWKQTAMYYDPICS